jgi:hypothetical protein
MKEINNWLLETSDVPKSSIHVNELIQVDSKFGFSDLQKSISLFGSGCRWLRDNNKKDRLFELHIELISEFEKIKLVPKNMRALVKSIDPFCVPEFYILDVESKPFLPNKAVLEYYQSPLPFEIDLGDQKNTAVCYNEYRSIEELMDNSPFSRWLIFSFVML